MIVATCAVGGALMALYLLLYGLGLSSLVCPTTGCETVQASPYSKLFGVPVAAYGLVWFLLIAGVASTGLWSERLAGIDIQKMLRLMTAVGVLAYVALTALEVFIIHALCFWCVLSSLAMLGAFVMSWLRRSA
jgi:uncharacterized membrane protein